MKILKPLAEEPMIKSNFLVDRRVLYDCELIVVQYRQQPATGIISTLRFSVRVGQIRRLFLGEEQVVRNNRPLAGIPREPVEIQLSVCALLKTIKAFEQSAVQKWDGSEMLERQ